jgi:hypothetical protein
MESTDIGNMMNVVSTLKAPKPYVPPRLQRLSPALVKSRLSRDADPNDSELRQLFQSVDQLHGAKGS